MYKLYKDAHNCTCTRYLTFQGYKIQQWNKTLEDHSAIETTVDKYTEYTFTCTHMYSTFIYYQSSVLLSVRRGSLRGRGPPRGCGPPRGSAVRGGERRGRGKQVSWGMELAVASSASR